MVVDHYEVIVPRWRLFLGFRLGLNRWFSIIPDFERKAIENISNSTMTFYAHLNDVFSNQCKRRSLSPDRFEHDPECPTSKSNR